MIIEISDDYNNQKNWDTVYQGPIVRKTQGTKILNIRMVYEGNGEREMKLKDKVSSHKQGLSKGRIKGVY